MTFFEYLAIDGGLNRFNVFTQRSMMLIAIISLFVGGLIGYGVAYTRYGDAKLIDELRMSHKKLQAEYQHLERQLAEYLEQNKILKHNAQHLLDQNEDFSKMISELSRYYYHIRQVSDKVNELHGILGVVDTDMEKKLARLADPIDEDDFKAVKLGHTTKKFF